MRAHNAQAGMHDRERERASRNGWSHLFFSNAVFQRRMRSECIYICVSSYQVDERASERVAVEHNNFTDLMDQ